MPDDDLALDTTDSPYGPELAQAPAAVVPPESPPIPGASRQLGYDPRTRPTPPPQFGPAAPPPDIKTVGGVDTNRLPFKPSVIDFNDDEEYMNGLRRDFELVKTKPIAHSGLEVAPQRTPQQHPRWKDYEDANKELDDAIAQGKVTNPKEAKDLRQHLDNMRRQIETETRAEAKKFNDQLQLETRRNDQQRMLPAARAKLLEQIAPYVDNVVTEHVAKLQTGDAMTKRQAEYDQTVSPLGTMARKKADGTMDYSLLRDTTATLMMLNSQLTNPEVVARAVLTMGSPPGFDDKTGKAITGTNGLRGKGAAWFQVLGHDRINPQNVIVRVKDGPTLALDPSTLRTIDKSRLMGYNAIKSWEEKEATKHAPTWFERGLETVVPPRGFR